MVNRKVFGLASALALFSTMGVAGQGGEEILSYYAEVVAELTDIEGIPIEVQTGRGHINTSREQIVEGHTVFHTMDGVRLPAQPVERVNVDGFIDCRWKVYGLEIPTLSVERVYAECSTGGRVFTGDANMAPPTTASDLQPTGWEAMVARPDTGERVLTQEYWYWSRPLDDPYAEPTRAYCWMTTIVPAGVNPHTGNAFNFVSAIRLDSTEAMGTERLRVAIAKDFFALGH